jgi:hypothetical protein
MCLAQELTEWNQGLFLQTSSEFLGASLLLELTVVKGRVSAQALSVANTLPSSSHCISSDCRHVLTYGLSSKDEGTGSRFMM